MRDAVTYWIAQIGGALAAWADIWIYLVGCFGGGFPAGLVFNPIDPDDKQVAQMWAKTDSKKHRFI